MELSEGHNDAWRKPRSVINPRKRSVYPTLTTTDEHNNVTKHTTTEQKLDAFADQLTKTFTNNGDTTNYDDNWKQTVDAYIDTNSQMLNVLDHLGGNVLHDENRITLPELDAKLKHLNTKKAKGLLPPTFSYPYPPPPLQHSHLPRPLSYGLETSHEPDDSQTKYEEIRPRQFPAHISPLPFREGA